MQDSRSCNFDGLGMVTFLDPSVGDCHFLVGVTDKGSDSSTSQTTYQWWTLVLLLILHGTFLLSM